MNRTMLVDEWRCAVNALGAAEVLMQAGYSEDSVSRRYYAVLHAAKSALLVHDIETASHAAVRRMFGLHLISSNEIERKWANVLSETVDDRLDADYGLTVRFSTEVTQSIYERAKAFLDRVREYLHSKGVTEMELASERGNG